jgi:hypothetical protein
MMRLIITVVTGPARAVVAVMVATSVLSSVVKGTLSSVC